MKTLLPFLLLLLPICSLADTMTQADLDRSKTEYQLCPKLAEYYVNGNAPAYLMLVDEIKKRNYGKKCLKIAEITMNLRKYDLVLPFKAALQEILDNDHPVETRRKDTFKE